jgi:hypothetical protein
LITVIVQYPNGQRKEVLLAGVPRVGEQIRLGNGAPAPSLIVDQVLWMDADTRDPEPQVLIRVTPRSDVPRL